MKKAIKPPRLKIGDKVAILSPSSGMPHLFPWVYEQGLQRIKHVFRLDPVEFPTARKSPQFLSENPKARAHDINEAFADPSIQGIIATIGGNDQIRILPYIDQGLIEKNPKIFLGYSDNTNLHLLLWNLGIVSYYGGSVMTQFAMGKEMEPYTIDSIRKALFSPSIGKIAPSFEYSDADLNWTDKSCLHTDRPKYPNQGWVWDNFQDRSISGKLWGGCLEVLHFHLCVKKFLPPLDDLEGAILFLETSEEMPSGGFVYRFIAALAEMGILQKFRAMLVGIPKAQFCNTFPPEGREVFIKNQHDAIKAALKDYEPTLPVVFNLNFGHTDPQMIIPMGSMATIDAKNKTIEFL